MDVDLWHMRLGHANKDNVLGLLRSDCIQKHQGRLSEHSKTICPSCMKVKRPRTTRHKNPARSLMIGEVFNSDLCGPMSFEPLRGSKYYVTFIDE